MHNAISFESIHGHGHVALESALGNDLAIVNNARVSFDQQSDEMTAKERGLLNFLMRERHGSPWEAVVFRFDVKAPLFVVREWQRHRISSFNEQSSRYSVIPEHYYVPTDDYVRRSKEGSKPGEYAYELHPDPLVRADTIQTIETAQRYAFRAYNYMLEMGIAKEQARVVLPVGMFTRMKWTVNLRSLFNFLSLRTDEQAQREIRDYAVAIERAVRSVVPVAMEVFDDNGRVAP